MDILLLLLQLIGIAIWLAILAPALILVSKFLFFLVMANNGGQYDPNLFILIWTIPLGLNVTSAIPPFIYSVGPGNHFMLLDPDIFFALFLLQGILDLISVATPSCFA